MLQITFYVPQFIVAIWEPLHNADDGLTWKHVKLRAQLYFVLTKPQWMSILLQAHELDLQETYEHSFKSGSFTKQLFRFSDWVGYLKQHRVWNTWTILENDAVEY